MARARASRPGSRLLQVKSSQVLQLQCFSPVPCQDPVYGGPDPLGVLELVLDTPRARRARAAWLQGCADSTMRTREQAEHWGRNLAGNCMYHSIPDVHAACRFASGPLQKAGITVEKGSVESTHKVPTNNYWPVHAAVHGETQKFTVLLERCCICRTFSDERAGSHSHSDRSRPARRADGTAHQWATPRPKKSRRHSCRLGVFSKRLA